jgi:mannose-6-phosphate isomerase-like protein (cupin superfamily)
LAEDDWKVFDLAELRARHEQSGIPYLEFLRVPDLSCGLYRLPAGARDLQSPHDEDEVYHVLEGRGRVRVEGEEREVGPGSILYVRATSEHSFFEIEEDMTLLVFFASGGPPEND